MKIFLLSSSGTTLIPVMLLFVLTETINTLDVTESAGTFTNSNSMSTSNATAPSSLSFVVSHTEVLSSYVCDVPYDSLNLIILWLIGTFVACNKTARRQRPTCNALCSLVGNACNIPWQYLGQLLCWAAFGVWACVGPHNIAYYVVKSAQAC